MAAPWFCRRAAVKKEDMSMAGYFRLLRQMFTERVFSPRTYVVAVLQGVMLYLYTRPVAAFSKDMGYAAAPWAYPFILSNIFFLLLPESVNPASHFQSRSQYLCCFVGHLHISSI